VDAVAVNSLGDDLITLGFLARSDQLRELGHSRSTLDAAIAEGWLLRPVRPWLATTSAERDAVIAIMHRGALTSASALGSYGMWRGLDRAIHVAVHPHSSGGVSRTTVPLASFAQPRHLTHGVVKHWAESTGGQRGWRVPAVDALAAFARNASSEDLVAAIDSGLQTGVLKPSDVPPVFARLPLRLQAAASLVNGQAESGTESIARLRLAGVARHIEIQVEIGPYRVDLLLDGWLAIEIDSEEWHASSRISDLRKATWLTVRGYRVEHFDYSQVMFDWPSVERAIRQTLGQPRPTRRSARR
jgi:very-short-patch-repair endonuclease